MTVIIETSNANDFRLVREWLSTTHEDFVSFDERFFKLPNCRDSMSRYVYTALKDRKDFIAPVNYYVRELVL